MNKHQLTYVQIVLSTLLICIGLFEIQAQDFKDSSSYDTRVLIYNNPEKAIQNGFQLYESAKNNLSAQVDALIIVANGYAVLKDHDNVLKYAFKADSIAKSNKNPTDRIRVLGFIGGEYQRLNLNNKALEYLDKAYDITTSHPLPDSLRYLQGNILFVRGQVMMGELGCEFALEYFDKANKVFKNNISSDAVNSSVAIASNRIGDCNFELGNYEEAKKNYEEAIVFARRINATKNIAHSELGLAKILSKSGEHSEAIEMLNNAMSAIESINDIGLNIEINKALSENYQAIGDIENFNKYTSLYLSDQEKLLSREKESLNKVTNRMSSENTDKRKNQQSNTLLFW